MVGFISGIVIYGSDCLIAVLMTTIFGNKTENISFYRFFNALGWVLGMALSILLKQFSPPYYVIVLGIFFLATKHSITKLWKENYKFQKENILL